MFWVVAARMRVRSKGGGIFGAGFWFGLFVCWRGLLIFGGGFGCGGGDGFVFVVDEGGPGGVEVCFGFEAMGGSFRGGFGVGRDRRGWVLKLSTML